MASVTPPKWVTVLSDGKTLKLPNPLPAQKAKFRNDSEAKLIKSATSRSPSCGTMLYRSMVVSEPLGNIALARSLNSRAFMKDCPPTPVGEVLATSNFPLAPFCFSESIGHSPKFRTRVGGMTSKNSSVYCKWFQLLN